MLQRLTVPSFVLVLASLPLRGHATGRDDLFRGVSGPEGTIDATTDDDRQNGQTRECQVFDQWIVIVVRTPGRMGPDQVLARPRAGRETDCAAQSPADVEMETEDEVVGVAADVLVTEDPDSDGSARGISFFALKSGALLFQTVVDEDLPVRITVRRGALQVRYHQIIDVPCRLTEASCWKHTLRKLALPALVSVEAPDCHDIDLSREPIQVFVPVHVDDIRKPAIIYESGQATCALGD